METPSKPILIAAALATLTGVGGVVYHATSGDDAPDAGAVAQLHLITLTCDEDHSVTVDTMEAISPPYPEGWFRTAAGALDVPYGWTVGYEDGHLRTYHPGSPKGALLTLRTAEHARLAAIAGVALPMPVVYEPTDAGNDAEIATEAQRVADENRMMFWNYEHRMEQLRLYREAEKVQHKDAATR